ncbi:MFS transporter [Pseudohalioglobus sediminis]|uniref:MFS transporter n=1 Tax=Pseudohalioglobus sediminis TaxID=2606449 RepID=UPI00165FEB55|nr:MFS transporter [Pseudohalioglobus sediminis]
MPETTAATLPADTAQAYQRAAEREGPVPVSVKLYQAIGALPDTFKNWAFNTFLLLLYNQVLGMPASLASLALMIALVFDAITDPLVGSFSDGLRSRWGRRHPLMYLSALPLAVSLLCLFSPPAALGEWGLFGWLLCFAVTTRGAMTLFLVPWSALFAELSDDYAERSSIITFRYVMGAVGTVVFAWVTWTYIFPSSESYPVGQLNPQAYPVFALVLAAVVLLSVLLTTILTMGEIKYLRQPLHKSDFGLGSTFRDLLAAVKNRDFMVLFGGLLVSSVLSGIVAAFEIYFHTFFWGFTSEDLRWFTLAIIGALIGSAMIPVIQRHFDKKHILLTAMVFSLVDGVAVISLRLLDILPANGEPLLLQLLIVNEVFRLVALTVTIIMFVSMVADTLDAQELDTGLRQEGVFSAAISFSGKAVSGFGVLITGLLLDYVIGFPQSASPDTVATETVFRLGVVGGIIVPLFYIVPFYMATRYNISRQRHAEIRTALAERYQQS